MINISVKNFVFVEHKTFSSQESRKIIQHYCGNKQMSIEKHQGHEVLNPYVCFLQ